MPDPSEARELIGRLAEALAVEMAACIEALPENAETDWHRHCRKLLERAKEFGHA